MKTKLPVIAALMLTSHLTLADGQVPEAEAVTSQADAVTTVQLTEETATDSQIKALEHNLTPDLQSMLDAQMSFDLEPSPYPLQGVASAY